MKIFLRQFQPADETFLFELYCSLHPEFLQLGLSHAQLQSLLKLQYDARESAYRLRCRAEEHQIIVYNEKRAGRIMVSRRAEVFHLVDIALLPEFRNLGIGESLLRQFIEEAEREKASASLNVETQNPALLLYQRLGFEIVNEQNGYYLMRFKS